MKNQGLQSTFSIITKEEDVKTLNHHIIPNTFVLEITHPYPGYYISDFITSNTKPQTLLLVLKKEVDFEFFYRKLTRIKKYSDFDFSADLAELKIYNSKHFAIRIKPLESYEQIIHLQKYFIDEGLNFKKSQKINDTALMKIFKFSNLRFENGIYHNTNNSKFMYFGINQELTWKQFEHITLKIRHNSGNIKFDAALGLFFHEGAVEDVIRIYTKDLDDKDANILHEMYLKELVNY